QDLAALALTSVAWRGTGTDQRRGRERLDAAVDTLFAGVHVVAGGARNLAATRSDLPVTVVNELTVPVTVDLVLRPRTPRLQLQRTVRLVLQPRSQQRVGVPVRALANGSVVVDAQLRTAAGTPVGAGAAVTVNIRMGVESWIVGGVAAAAGLLLVVGLVRAVRRGRRRMDAARLVVRPAEDAGGR
ncbi:DUF6049 family protein, partial [Kineococcus glutinatus]|uniref:DUF6049 family protein n=1 Tax=Kineococcus glutinatus TaxID=1070872 RepID=UPI0031EB3C21